jgi:hypothetical protein
VSSSPGPPNPAASTPACVDFVDPETAGRLVAWSTALLTGRAAPSAAAAAIEAGSHGHVVEGFPGSAAEVSLADVLARLPDAAPRRLAMVLPVSGDPLGLSSTDAFARAALMAEVGVALEYGSDSLGLVPEPDPRGSSYLGVRWRVYPGSAAAVPPVTIDPSVILEQSERELRRALRAATESLAGLNLAHWRAESVAGREAADLALRARVRALPPNWPAPARALGERALALWRVLRVASRDAGAASASASVARGEALRGLSRAVRDAAMVAYNVPAAALLDTGTG